MTLASTVELVSAAQRSRTAVGAFNIITLEHAEAVVDAAVACNTPVILQISENAIRYHDGRFAPLIAAAEALAAEASVPIALHLDHVTDLQLIQNCSRTAISSAMFDAGARPYRENVELTRAAVALARDNGLWLEAELGYVGGKPDAPRSAHAVDARTDPGEAKKFVEATGVDALAIAIGSSHAMTERTARLDHHLVERITGWVPVPLVLHGSSGVPADQLRAAVRAGITKVNIGTALNVAATAAIRDALADHPEWVDPRSYLAPARAAMACAAYDLLCVLRSPDSAE